MLTKVSSFRTYNIVVEVGNEPVTIGSIARSLYRSIDFVYMTHNSPKESPKKYKNTVKVNDIFDYLTSNVTEFHYLEIDFSIALEVVFIPSKHGPTCIQDLIDLDSKSQASANDSEETAVLEGSFTRNI